MRKFMGDKIALSVFVIPALLVFVVFIFVPIVFSAYYSLFEWDGVGARTFIGIQNFVDLFTESQDFFVLGIKNSIILALLSVFVQLPLALLLALVVARIGKGEGFFRSVYFIPVVISTTVLGQLWMRIYHPGNGGLLNIVLKSLGLDSLTHAWLGESSTALGAAFVVLIWQYIGYHMLLMYSAIKTIPTGMYEAAAIDGATGVQATFRITIPLIMPMIKTCVTFAIIGSFKTFDLIYVLTKGGPIHATEVPSTLMFSTIFLERQYGYGSSMAVFILLECLVVTVLIQRFFKAESYEY